jgi:hypothetical protein
MAGQLGIGTLKPFPATSDALVVRHLVIHQASANVVLGFIGRTGRHPPNDYSDAIAGVAGWALSLHDTKLLTVTDKKWATRDHYPNSLKTP